MSKLTKALTAAAGNAGGDNLYVEDVFSTYLYEGTNSAMTITNGIDLDGEGGLVWIKNRTTALDHVLGDTERGVSKALRSNTSDGNFNYSEWINGFNSDGFSVGASGNVSDSNNDYASWTFRKAEKFFDVVTWTGDGTGVRTISHSLNGTVGALFMKATNVAMQWFSYHNGLTNAQFLELNATTTAISNANAWNNTTPTSSEFTVGSYGNISGRTYVAYLFASDAGGFGDDENIIKCGSYTGTGAAGNEVNLGFEPQWLMVKRTDSTGGWVLFDNMRGFPVDGTDVYFYANSSASEGGASYDFGAITATGFIINHSSDPEVNASGGNYIYIAIRRPMKTPESGTEVFATAFDAGGTSPTYVSGFVADMGIQTNTTGYNKRVSSRLTSGKYLEADNTGAEQTSSSNYTWDFMNGWNNQSINSTWLSWMFKRATGFFDVVAYTGTGVIGSTKSHNLGVAPELMIVKNRSSSADNWPVYHKDAGTGYLFLNKADAYRTTAFAWNNTNPNDSTFTVHSNSQVNGSGFNYIAYLFATLAGVSKVGSYTGTGADLDVDCGFSAGARFVMIKRTDSTGDWYVYDSVRGIVAGNDPYLLLNSTAAEVTSTDYIDPLSSGFTVTSSAPAALNASGGSYIFLAIA